MTIDDIRRMTQRELRLKRKELELAAKWLVGDLRRYYAWLPEVCWMTEANQARKLKLSRCRVRNLKRILVKKDLIFIEKVENGKRANHKHIAQKTLPIILRRLEEKEEISNITFSKKESFTSKTNDTEIYDWYERDEELLSSAFPIIDWKLLQGYTAQELNQMGKMEQVHLYLDCGFLVLPTHYPIFEGKGVRCSCKNASQCPNIGKHSLFKYAHLDQRNYDFVNKRVITAFENNPNLNIGFKVLGYSVLDVDNRHQGDKTLDRLQSEYGVNFDNSLTVQCSNGKHVYATNTNLKNNAGVLGDGLDIRSDTGFIIAPSSVHKSGTSYQWKQVGDLATMPNVWFEKEEENEGDRREETNESRPMNRSKGKVQITNIKLPKQLTSDYFIPDGQRHSTLFLWACRERGKGATADQIFDCLESIRDTFCDEGSHPVSDVELRSIAESVAKKYTPNRQKKAFSK